MKKILTVFISSILLLGTVFWMPSCDPVDPITLDQALGWFGIGGTNGDDLAGIEDDIFYVKPVTNTFYLISDVLWMP